MSAAFRDDEDIFLRLPVRDGRAATRLELVLEDGERRGVDLRAGDLETISWRGVDGRVHEGLRARLPRLPLGRHIVSLEGTDCRLTVAPRRCHAPRIDGRAFGLAAQLYSLRRDGDQGVGDFTTLSQLGALAAGHGRGDRRDQPAARAVRPGSRTRQSLLSVRPSLSRPDLSRHRSRRRFLQRAERRPPGRLSRRSRLEAGVSRTRVQGLRAFRSSPAGRANSAKISKASSRMAATLCFASPVSRRSASGAAAKTGGAGQGRCATENRSRWQASRAKTPAASAIINICSSCAKANSRRRRRAAEKAGLALGFCRDLAVGAAPDGCESWRGAAHLLKGFSIGAPPDGFTRDGQNWGLPPPDPLRWKADGCESFGELLRANMRHAGALRIDHVMGLARLFVVPDGGKPLEGAYLSYPLDNLLAELALESHRAQCMVIGEDLGTLPWGFSERLADSGILSYRVLWFEREGEGFAPPAHYPRMAMACVSTHDLPTLKGWWEGADIAEKLALGLLSDEDARKERETRREDRRLLLEALAREGLLAEDVEFRRCFQRRSRRRRACLCRARARAVGDGASRRSRRRNDRGQSAGNRPGAPKLAAQARPENGGFVRKWSGASDFNWASPQSGLDFGGISAKRGAGTAQNLGPNEAGEIA